MQILVFVLQVFANLIKLQNELNNTVVLCTSLICLCSSTFFGAEGLDNVVTLSTMRGAEFKETMVFQLHQVH